MADKKKGYIKLYRSVWDNWVWNNKEPFDSRSAWVDLLLMANHKEKKILIAGSIVTIQAGQMWTSHVKLAKRWHWNRKRVIRFLNLLQSDGMIYQDGTTHGTCLTLLNWRVFEDWGTAVGTTVGTAPGAAGGAAVGTAVGTQTRMKKNVKNVKNEKETRARAQEIAPPRGGGEWQ